MSDVAPQPIVVPVMMQPPVAAPPTQTYSLDEVLARVEATRKEEKDKLYPEIERLNGEVRTLSQEREERLADEQRLAQEAAEASAREEESRLSIEERLAARDQEWEGRFQQMNAEREADRALLEKERQYGELQTYIKKRTDEEIEKHSLAPELAVHVRGNTVDEVEASIASFEATTARIAEQIAAVAPPAHQPPPRLPGSGAPPVDFLGGGGDGLGEAEQVTLTPEDIRAMTMEEYGAYRSNLIAAASARARAGGLYQP